MDDTRNSIVDERLERLETQARELRSTLYRVEQQLEVLLVAGMREQSSHRTSGAVPPLPFSPTLIGDGDPQAHDYLEATSTEDALARMGAGLAWDGPPHPHSEDDSPAIPPPSPSEAAELAPAPPMKPAFVFAGGPRLAASRSPLDVVRSAEYWLSKVGIVLLLFGVAFLFKYTIDRHLLSEEGRVITGLALGTLLLALGLRLHRNRRHFSLVLLGGSIATYYITGYAASQLFPGLGVSYEVAFGFMVVVTLLALTLSVRQDEAVLSLIGVTGGLLTPFVLSAAYLDLVALISYSCLVLAGASAIYLSRGWRSLLWISVAGAWAILQYGRIDRSWITERSWHYEGYVNDLWALQAGAACTLLAFWAIPVLREVLHATDAKRWPRPALGLVRDDTLRPFLDLHAHVLTVLTPLAALGFSALLWSDLVSRQTWGWTALSGALLFASVFLAIRRVDSRLAYAQAFAAVALLTIALISLLEGNALLLALAAEALALHLLSRRFSDEGAALAGHLLFGAVAAWLASRLLPGAAAQLPHINNPQALTDLAVIALALAASFLTRPREVTLAYRSLAHLALLAWLWRELHGFEHGDGYVMLAWAAYGLLLHLVSRRIPDRLNATGASIAAHLAFEGAMGLLALRMVSGYQEGHSPIFNDKAVTDLAFMALALAASFAVRPAQVAAAYRLSVHVAALAWILREATWVDYDHGYIMLRWAAYLTMVAFISHRLSDRPTLLFTNVPYVAVALLFVERIVTGHAERWAIFSAQAWVDLMVIALALGASFVAQPEKLRTWYRYAVHGAVLAWLWRELGQPPYGEQYVMLSWAAYATLLHLVGRVLRDETTRIAAHAIFATSGLWLVSSIVRGLLLVNEDQERPIFNDKGLTYLAVIALGGIVYCVLRITYRPYARPNGMNPVAFILHAIRNTQYVMPQQALPVPLPLPLPLPLAYGLWLHVAFLGWMWQELGLMPSGNGFVTLAWGAYAIALVAAGLRLGRSRPLLYCGLATLFAVAAKLFLIDLRYLDAIWRILLFLGFGGLFLLLSYLFQGLAKGATQE